MAKTKKSSVSDLMKAAGTLATTVTKVANKKDERPQLDIDSVLMEEFVDYATINSVFTDLQKHNESMKTQLNGKLFTLWKDLIWKLRNIPENPKLESMRNGLKDITGIFQCFVKKDSLKYDPLNDDSSDKDPEDKTVDLFVNIGLNEEAATSLVENELLFISHTYIPFEELAEGVYEKEMLIESSATQKEAARKVLSYITAAASNGKMAQVEALTDEERSMILRRKIEVKVKDGFFERIFTYCETREDLDLILSIIKPVFYLSHVKFAVSDSETDKLDRKIKAVKEYFFPTKKHAV